MSEFVVSSSKGHYCVKLGMPAEKWLQESDSGLPLFFLDKNVGRLHPWVRASLPSNHTIELEPSERLKSYEGVAKIVQLLIARGAGRDVYLKVIGGGVLQDVISFTASIYYRGVKWSFVPTTLLAQADSCIGSKTSINFGAGKNQLGNFYPPASICIDPRFLQTLPEEQFRSGLGEIFHYLLVSSENDFDFGKKAIETVSADRAETLSLIERSLEIKKALVEVDEFDAGPRRIFNYGHTFGHAIETASEFKIPHGIAVAIGMDISNYLSVQMGLVSSDFRNRVRDTLQLIWQADRLDLSAISRFIDALSRDKKNENGEVKAILTKGFGQMFLTTLSRDKMTLDALEKYFREDIQGKNI